MNAYCLHTIIKSKNCKSKHCKLGLSMYVLSLSTTWKILVLFSHSVVSYSLRPHGLPTRQPSLSFTISWSLLKLRSIKSMMPSYHLILCHPLLLLPSVFPSRSFPVSCLFASGGQSIGASASSSVLPMNIQGFISFKIDRFDLLAVQGTLKSLSPAPQLESTSSSCSAFFMVQLLHPNMTTGKTIALTRQTCVSKVMSLLFNTLSRFDIAFLPRSKYFLISWLQSLSAVILEPKKRKSVTVSIVSPSICIKWWDWMPCS